MAVLSGDLIRKLVQAKVLRIEPFRADALQPASYDLRLAKRVLVSPIGGERGRAVDLDKEKDRKISIRPGQFVATLTDEELGLPADICGRFGIKSVLARKGLVAFGGIQVDPGFIGRLAISLFNVGPESIDLEMGAPIFTIEFTKLEEPTKSPYSGEYQYQSDFPADQYNFVLGARTISLAEIPNLKEEIKRVNDRVAGLEVLREDIEEILEDPDRGKELKEEVKERLRRSLSVVGKGRRDIPASDVAKKSGLAW